MKSGLIYITFLCFFLLVSCSETSIIPPSGGGNLGKEEVEADFVINFDKGPSTYALDVDKEIELKEVTVLAFKVNGSSETFAQASSTSNFESVGTRQKFTVKLKKSSDQHRFVIIANDPLAVYPCIDESNVGRSKDDLLSEIVSVNSGKWDTGLNYRRLPMWGESTGTASIDENLSLADPVILLRAVARVDVLVQRELNSVPKITEDSFKLREVHVYNTKSKGLVVPYKANFNSSTHIVSAASLPSDNSNLLNPSPLVYVNAVTNTDSCSHEIYLYESNKLDLGKDLDVTCLVIGGNYRNSSDLRYYRVDFASRNGNDITGYTDILRNHNYRFTITAVNNEGHSTPQEAFESRTVNMTVKIERWVDEPTDPYEPTEFEFTISNSEFKIGAESFTGLVEILTDHPKGWGNITASESWVNLTKISETELRFTVGAYAGPSRSCEISVSVGNITKKIKITQN